jgi:hypothetical protein
MPLMVKLAVEDSVPLSVFLLHEKRMMQERINRETCFIKMCVIVCVGLQSANRERKIEPYWYVH